MVSTSGIKQCVKSKQVEIDGELRTALVIIPNEDLEEAIYAWGVTGTSHSWTEKFSTNAGGEYIADTLAILLDTMDDHIDRYKEEDSNV